MKGAEAARALVLAELAAMADKVLSSPMLGQAAPRRRKPAKRTYKPDWDKVHIRFTTDKTRDAFNRAHPGATAERRMVCKSVQEDEWYNQPI